MTTNEKNEIYSLISDIEVALENNHPIQAYLKLKALRTEITSIFEEIDILEDDR